MTIRLEEYPLSNSWLSVSTYTKENIYLTYHIRDRLEKIWFPSDYRYEYKIYEDIHNSIFNIINRGVFII